jgi:hypothetical protein
MFKNIKLTKWMIFNSFLSTFHFFSFFFFISLHIGGRYGSSDGGASSSAQQTDSNVDQEGATGIGNPFADESFVPRLRPQRLDPTILNVGQAPIRRTASRTSDQEMEGLN